KSLELNRHIRDGWHIFSAEMKEFIEILPPMKRVVDEWYRGTADAVYQNLQSILTESPEDVLILSADHIYKMNYREMLSWHRLKDADITIATIQIDPREAHHFGIAEIDEHYRIFGFEEKPKHGNPRRSPFDRGKCSASMGIYIFKK